MTGVVIITGGSRGIGAATAELLAGQGWSPCVSYRDRADAAEEVVARCQAIGAKASAMRADVSVEDDVLRLFRAAEDELGPVRALVNNAGIVAPRSRVADFTAERLDRMFGVNVLGPLLCAREAVRRLSTASGGPGGSIVNVSSRASELGGSGEYVDYAASKAAVDTFTVGLAKEVAQEGIRVNAVRPGLIDTEIHASGGQPDRIERVKAVVPMGRAGQPLEIAEAIAWLLSDRASYVTGALLDVGGGR
ncbi:MAG TPA: SDR family oxidoreductase [Pseudonocardiaceae bacterium]|jgi:NAD(P)-dependent dehydrogenase (short-subunit alcohol dehydrogenase family)|nr:SDR family oxidoreductase [Pseudonocardiaceae bacterium]